MPPETTLHLPDGRDVSLWRDPGQAQPDNLRAWDAADELVAIHLAEAGGGVDALADRRVLVVGDGFGALQVFLARRGPDGGLVGPAAWTDSVVSQRAGLANLALNGVTAGVQVGGATPPPAADLVVVKVPKSAALLEDQLRQVVRAAGAGAQVIGAGMTRHVHTSTVDAFDRIVGPATTTRARKKARLVLATVDAGRPDLGPAEPAVHDSHGVQVLTLPGVFSHGRRDAGTDLLLRHVTLPAGGVDVVDLGCGSVVVGTVLAARDPEARIVFTDDSHRAVASAEMTFRRAHGDRPAVFHVADVLEACPDASADLVVVNPPFHRGHEVGDEVAWRMFGDARRVLRPGGHIVVVGNRHLGHHARLGRLYGGSEVLGSDPAYVVLRSTRL